MQDMQLLYEDCLDALKDIEDESIDMIFADPPYGTTNGSWDIPIDSSLLFDQIRRVIKKNGACLLWSQMPFTADLVVAGRDMFRYEWIVEKTKPTGFLNARKMPMKSHENVLVFYKNLPTYNPQKTTGHKPVNSFTKHTKNGDLYGDSKPGISGGGQTDRFPRDVLKFKWDTQKSKLHPTQKPLAALEYFIKTYTNEGDTVLDMCMGSGSTGVAALNLNRKFIGIEKDLGFYNTALSRITLSTKDRIIMSPEAVR